MNDHHHLVARLAALPTAAVSDALDRLGVEGALHGLAPLANEFRAVGPAYTVRYQPIDSTSATTAGSVGDFLDDVPPGAIVVIDNRGCTDATVWGGIMTEVAAQRGVGGTVIDGVCRDVAASLRHSYPLFTRGRYMRTGKDRVRLAATQEPVTVCGIPVRPGDVVSADADGALVVPLQLADQVADLAADIDRIESEIVTAATGGITLAEARHRFGYHTLQTRSQT